MNSPVCAPPAPLSSHRPGGTVYIHPSSPASGISGASPSCPPLPDRGWSEEGRGHGALSSGSAWSPPCCCRCCCCCSWRGGPPWARGCTPCQPASCKVSGAWGPGIFVGGFGCGRGGCRSRDSRAHPQEGGANASRMAGSLAKPPMPAPPGLGGKCCLWHSGTLGLQGAVWFMSCCHQLSFLPWGPVPAPRDPSARAWPAGGQLWAGTGGHRYGDAHTGHAQGCTHMSTHRDVQTQAHRPWHTHLSAPGVCTEVHARRHAWAHLPRLTPCSMPTSAHVCSQGLHVQRAHTGPGKHPPHTMSPCANPTREVTVMPATLGDAHG